MKTNHIITTCLLGLSLGLTSCDSPMEEIKNIIFDRVFSPIGLEAKNIGENNATLNWTATTGVKSYQVEVYADDSLTFTGSPILTVKVNNPTLELKNLVYDTKYSARVMALDTADVSRNSKWSEVYFRTNAQQILTAFSLEDIGDKDIVAHWPAGEDADNIIVFNTATGGNTRSNYIAMARNAVRKASKLSLISREQLSFALPTTLAKCWKMPQPIRFLRSTTAPIRLVPEQEKTAPVLRSSTKILPLRASIQPQSPKYKDASKWKTVPD